MRLPKKTFPLGYSDLMPEGIAGLTEGSSYISFDPWAKKVKVKVKKDPKPKAKKPRVSLKQLKNETIEAIKRLINMQPLTDLIKPKKKKVKKAPKESAVKTPEVAVKVQTAREIDHVKRNLRKVHKERLFKGAGVLPELSINYDNLAKPSVGEDLELSNVVEVSETMLNKVAKVTEIRTKRLGELLLSNTAPSILAHAAAVNYVGAVMQDGFDIEFEEDQSVSEAIKDITKIEILEFFTSKLRVPKHRKEHIMKSFVEKLTTRTVDRMESLLKSDIQEKRIKALEAVLVQNSNKSSGGRPVAVTQKATNSKEHRERIIERPMIKPTRGNYDTYTNH